MIGTLWSTHVSMSEINLMFDLWQIWLTANGAATLSGFLFSKSFIPSFILLIQSSRVSGSRAFKAGNDPITPDVHWLITRFGFEIVNIGAATTGILKLKLLILYIRFFILFMIFYYQNSFT